MKLKSRVNSREFSRKIGKNRQKTVKIDENRLKSRKNKKKTHFFFLVFLFDNHVWAGWIVSHENYWVKTNISIF
jgi:hypothetical protein